MTTPQAPRRQQAEERREQILDAAMKVFSEKGFAGASVRDIAGSIGVTEGLIYHYFESKDQLMNACWKERSWHAHLGRILTEAKGVPLEKVLRDIVVDFLQTLREHAPSVRICMAESQRSPEIAAWLLARFADNQRLIVDFLGARAAAGEIRTDVRGDTAAGLLMGCAHSCFMLFGDSDDATWTSVVQDLAQHGVDIVMRGLLPR